LFILLPKRKSSSDLKYFIIKRDNRFWHEIGKRKILRNILFWDFLPELRDPRLQRGQPNTQK
jgi:hypothetical protein